MKPIAVIGASGFVGVRMVEMFHLGGRGEVRPILSRPASLAPLARFQLDWRMADATHADALAKTLEGCGTVVHLAAGNPVVIRALTTPVYEAAALAGVKRLVFMSSASVHGQAPAQGTTETTPLPKRQALAYNTAKAWAERQFAKCRAKGAVELVVLRPGIVWGPRSRWIVEMVEAMRSGNFGWLNGGTGIINPIYVDNLVHAIALACEAPVDRETFLLNDAEPVTWREFYAPWMKAFQVNADKVPYARPFMSARGLGACAERIRTHRATQRVAPKIPGMVKRIIKGFVSSLPAPAAPNLFEGMYDGQVHEPRLTREMTELMRCAWRFPCEAARTRLGWKQQVNWTTAVERTLAWMRFAGYLDNAGS